MKKALALLMTLVSAVIYYASNNPVWTEAYTSWRTDSGLLPVAHRGLGDLYNMCFLSEYNGPLNYHLRKASPEAHGIALYLICDSYLISHVEKEHFYGADTLVKMKWWGEESYRTIPPLHSAQKNVLIIELAERFVRDVCEDFNLMTAPLKVNTAMAAEDQSTATEREQVQQHDFIERHFFNPNINTNLELNLFSYKIFNRVKEWKGDLNYRLFNRINKDIYLDEKNHFLFFSPTLSGEVKSNSFFPIDSSETARLIETLSRTRTHYVQLGFNEVFFTFVPNPVSVIRPDLGQYNGLMPALYAADTSMYKTIDVYRIFKENPKKYYAYNDTHWNSDGLQTWLDETNRYLRIISRKK